MRSTVTLDDDVAAKLKAQVRRTGKTFTTVFNGSLSVALSSSREGTRPVSFRIEAGDLGPLRPGLSLWTT